MGMTEESRPMYWRERGLRRGCERRGGERIGDLCCYGVCACARVHTHRHTLTRKMPASGNAHANIRARAHTYTHVQNARAIYIYIYRERERERERAREREKETFTYIYIFICKATHKGIGVEDLYWDFTQIFLWFSVNVTGFKWKYIYI